MTKNHLKRNAANKRWDLLRKADKFVLKAIPGKHSLDESVPLGYFLKKQGFADTAREAKKLLLMNVVCIDKRKEKEIKSPVGFMDLISINNESFRCLFDKKGRFEFIKVDPKEADKKICKILGKTKRSNDKIQLNLVDGRNILLDKEEFKVGDSLVLELPSQKIIKHLPLKEGMSILLIGGKYVGRNGVIKKILDNHIYFKDASENEFSTLKDYAFVVGEKNPELKIK